MSTGIGERGEEVEIISLSCGMVVVGRIRGGWGVRPWKQFALAGHGVS